MLVTKLREAHHAVARYVARGLPLEEVSGLTGHPVERLSALRGDSSFCELVGFYRERVADAVEDDVMQAIRDVVRAA